MHKSEVGRGEGEDKREGGGRVKEGEDEKMFNSLATLKV